LKPCKYFVLTCVLISSHSVFAIDTDPSKSFVHNYLGIEMDGVIETESAKTTIYNNLDELSLHITNGTSLTTSEKIIQGSSLADLVKDYATSPKSNALKILNDINTVLNDPQKFVLVDAVEQLFTALTPVADGKYNFDCDTTSLVYVEVLQKLFLAEKKELPVTLLYCDGISGYVNHTVLRWYLDNKKETYFEWDATESEGNYEVKDKAIQDYYTDKNDCQEIIPGSDFFYAKALSYQGEARSTKKDYAGAIAALTTSLQTNPSDVLAYRKLGLAEYFAKDYAASLATFNKAIELRPDIIEDYEARGMIKNDMGNYQSAIIDFEKAITLFKNISAISTNNPTLVKTFNTKFATLYSSIALAYQKLEDPINAILYYNKAITSDPTYATAYRNRAIIEFSQKKYDEAQEDYINEFTYAPSKSTAKTCTEYCIAAYCNTQEYSKALSYFNKIISVETSTGMLSAQTYTSRGITKYYLEDYLGATDDFGLALKIDPTYAIAYFDRSIVEVTNNDCTNAVLDCNKAIELNSDVYTSKCTYITDKCK